MKFCQPHWDALKQAVIDAGLEKYIANTTEGAIEKLKVQLDAEKGDRSKGFDPLLNANFAIWNNALERGGMYLMYTDEDGNPYCPICESEKHNGPTQQWWIDNAVNEQVEKARSLGYLPPNKIV